MYKILARLDFGNQSLRQLREDSSTNRSRAMKVFLSIALIASVAMAEPPRQNRYFVARQESAPYPASGWRPDGPAFNLPQRQQQAPDNQYGAPQRQQQPDNQYGAPQRQQTPDNQYGAPQNQYGAPNGRQQLPQQGYGAPQQERFRAQPAKQQQQPRQQYGPPPQQYGPPQQEYPSPSAPFPSSTEYPGNEFEQPTTVQSEFAESEVESSTPVNEFEEDQDIDQPQQDQTKSDKGQYYVALPDGRLQRVQYVSRQDIEAMRYFAKIKAENVEPLRGPIYAYSPLQELVAAAPEQPSTLTITANERKPEKLRQPKVDIRPLAQVQYQHDVNPGQVVGVGVNTPSAVVPLSSSYTTFTANYAQQLPATVPVEDRLILAYP